MNSTNVRIRKPLLLTAFTITVLVCLTLVALTLVRDKPGGWWQLAEAPLYPSGCVAWTMAVDMPLDNQLAVADPTTAAGLAPWHD